MKARAQHSFAMWRFERALAWWRAYEERRDEGDDVLAMHALGLFAYFAEQIDDASEAGMHLRWVVQADREQRQAHREAA